jgi:hypothetical protein
MNKRIKQLAEQARAEVRADWAKGNKIPYPEAHYAFQRDNDQKFAELIVKECAGKVDFILREKSNGGGTMGDEIREHFGVEE